jgi:hypothetical protein
VTMKTKIVGLSLTCAGAAYLMVAGMVDVRAQVGSSAVQLTVSVFDRAEDTPIPAVTVRVMQSGKMVASNPTGAKGTVTFSGLNVGATLVHSERDGYLLKPQSDDTMIRAGANTLRVTLLAEKRDQNYFRQAGQQIEKQGAALQGDQRNAFFLREWNRVKALPTEHQIPLATEIKTGRMYLANDGVFDALLKSGRVISE